MKQGNIAHWSNKESCKNLLFFAQLVDELLFDYSIPSNRISTLNSHYLCLDALSTITTISENGVPEGTLKPVLEELYRSLDTDITFKLCNENPMRYFVKCNNGKYIKAKQASDLNYDEAKRIIIALYEKYFNDDWYVHSIIKNIKEIVIKNSIDDWQNLFRLTKIFLTEIVNSGYSSRYIFEKLHYFFFSAKNEVLSPQLINNFFDVFDFKKKKYTIVFKTIRENITFLETSATLKIEENFPRRTKAKKEKKFLMKDNNETYVVGEIEAVDPYTASKKIKNILKQHVSFYKLYDHKCKFVIKDIKWGIYDSADNFMIIEDDKSAVHKSKSLSKQEISNRLMVLQKAIEINMKRRNIEDIRSLYNAISFHSLSIESISEENQLLDMWAIFESLLTIDNKTDRISQICSSISPVLKRKYFYSLFLQLAQDIKNYDKGEYKKITGSLTVNDVTVKKICEFVLLDEYKQEREAFLTKSADFPLLIERVNYYNAMLATTSQVYHFIEKHSERVRWQIMRIYRNRNLIIHNGDSMPYLKLLVENLHAYIDDFLDYTIQAAADKWTIESMYQEAIVQESEWLNLFGGKKENISSIHIEQMLKNL